MLRDLGREVDASAARTSESSTSPLSRNVLISRRAGFRLLGQKCAVCPNPASTTCVAVRQVGQQLLRRDLRRRREVELPADEERLHLRRPHPAVLALVRAAGHASASPPPPQTKSSRWPRFEPRPARRRRSSRRAAWARAPRRRRLAPDERFGKTTSARSDWNQNPLASPSAAESHASSVIGPERRRLRRRLHRARRRRRRARCPP